MRNKISIIVPIYNISPEYLQKCVGSLCAQSYSDIEILLVDDGSDEQHAKYIDDIATSDNRIRLIRQKNQGVSATRNKGIAEATGDYIMFVDADDWLEERACETLLNSAAEYCADIVFGKTFINPEDREGRADNTPEAAEKKVINDISSKRSLIKSVLCQGNVMYKYVDTVWAKLYKTDFLRSASIGFLCGVRMSEDALFNIEAYTEAKTIVYADEFVYHYRVRAGSACTGFHPLIAKSYAEVIDAMNTLFEGIPEYDMRKELDYYTNRCLYKIISKYIFAKEHPLYANKSEHKKEFFEIVGAERYRRSLRNIKDFDLRSTLVLNLAKCKQYKLLRLLFSLR